MIEEESMRLARMATNVLDLTRLENQEMLTDVVSFNLSEQIRACILLLDAKWSAKGVQFQVDFGEYSIAGSQVLLQEAWINLLDNAIKFSSEGGTVEVAISRAERMVSVTVSNTGQEIPPDLRKKVFDKFYQADRSRATEGNGLGLAIVKRVVELHQGGVTVECDGGKTAFTVILPDQA